MQALLQRGIRSGLCSPETPNLTELAESVDDTLFQRIMHYQYHVLYHLLPERRELVYNIRPRHHDRQLRNPFVMLYSFWLMIANGILPVFTAC